MDDLDKMDDIVFQMIKMVGYCPVGTRDLLRILAHPDMIDLTRKFLDESEASK